MKKLVFLLLLINFIAPAQETKFNPEEYSRFLELNRNMSYESLTQNYPSGPFLKKVSATLNPKYLDSLNIHYNFTNSELALIREHGFLVTERLSYSSFASAFSEIYHNDLPVYVSTDAIAHALHMSYDEILKQVEVDITIPKLKELLGKLYAGLPALDQKYAGNELFRTCLKDVDIYISVARSLLKEGTGCYYPENATVLNSLLDRIKSLAPSEVLLFSSSLRDFDFSQFKVRGHYTDTNFPQLANYFTAMIWFGRTELYFTSPQSTKPQKKEDLQRQIIDAFLVKELLASSGSEKIYDDINSVIESFVGEQDNITIDNLNTLQQKLLITDLNNFSDTAYVTNFQTELGEEPFSEQKILSQILITGLGGPAVKPGAAFMLFGQRFIVDSYVFSKVVFSNIVYNNQLIHRMLPNSLDILFALGNNGAGKLLESELNKFHYASNLNSLRYLINSYGDDFWNKSLYNVWLNSIRDLNPPEDISKFPQSMQTAAFWQSKITGQLASWAQLRHDNLLYAKQSYSGGIICSYPYSYVDPFPEFYGRIVSFAKKATSVFNNMNYSGSYIVSYLNILSTVCGKLKTIAEKELNSTALSSDEKSFLAGMLRTETVCGSDFSGWYKELFYRGESSLKKNDLVIADVHTAPTDEVGNPVGWIKHAATGNLNMSIVVANNYNNELTAFIGPVLSYFDYTTSGFLRLSDEEWAAIYKKNILPGPDFSNLYMAGKNGEKKTEGPTLLMVNNPGPEIDSYILLKNYPNPFNPNTNIIFSIPADVSGNDVSINIYDITGRHVKTIFQDRLPTGTYILSWDGSNSFGKDAATGVYICNLRAGKRNVSIKMNLIK